MNERLNNFVYIYKFYSVFAIFIDFYCNVLDIFLLIAEKYVT